MSESGQAGASEPAASPEYLEYAQGSQELQKEFESRLFWLAGGAVTLVVAGAPALRQKGPLLISPALVASVALLVLGLVGAMVGFRVSAIMFNKYAEYWHDHDTSKYKSAQAMQPCVTALDWGSFAAVVAGLCFAGVFYLVNVLG